MCRLSHFIKNAKLNIQNYYAVRFKTKHATRIDLPVDIFNSLISWEVMSKARKEASLYLRILITKWVSGEIATGSIMVQIKQRIFTNCPMCQADKEDTTHILKCADIISGEFRKDLLHQLKVYLLSIQTQPVLNHGNLTTNRLRTLINIILIMT